MKMIEWKDSRFGKIDLDRTTHFLAGGGLGVAVVGTCDDATVSATRILYKESYGRTGYLETFAVYVISDFSTTTCSIAVVVNNEDVTIHDVDYRVDLEFLSEYSETWPSECAALLSQHFGYML